MKTEGLSPPVAKPRQQAGYISQVAFAYGYLVGTALAKMGATGKLAPPRECQVKLVRLMDLHFLACLPQASMFSAFTHKAHPGREA